jgi:hypothetical protein
MKPENTIHSAINDLRTEIDNIKEEVTNHMETSEKRMKQKYKTKWKATPADNKQKTETQNSNRK